MEQPIGSEGGLKLELVDGKVKLSLVYDSKGIDGALSASADAEYFVNKVFDLIPGDSMLEQMAKTVLLGAIKSAKL